MQLGVSFSHIHLKDLKLDPMKALKEFNDLDLEWIRLACYWKDIEKKEGINDFTEIENLVKYCESKNIKIVMTIGMKAPRMPEYYLPDWLEEKVALEKHTKINTNNELLLKETLGFLEQCVKYLGKYSIIKIWQIENEPLDPSGPARMAIDKQFLEKEVEHVRNLDPHRNILVNLWGNALVSNNRHKIAANIADIVGIDLYPKQYAEYLNKYIGPIGPKFLFDHKVRRIRKWSKLWITELQAEPWEPKYAYKSDTPFSFMPDDFETNMEYASKLDPEVVLLWGYEYWYLRKENYKDNRYWKEAKEVIKKYQDM